MTIYLMKIKFFAGLIQNCLSRNYYYLNLVTNHSEQTENFHNPPSPTQHFNQIDRGVLILYAFYVKNVTNFKEES